MEKKVITDAAVVKAIRNALPLVSLSENGLMSKEGFLYRFQTNDLNEATLPGWSVVFGKAENNPANETGILLVLNIATTYVVQLMLCINFNRIYMRRKINEKWDKWTVLELTTAPEYTPSAE